MAVEFKAQQWAGRSNHRSAPAGFWDCQRVPEGERSKGQSWSSVLGIESVLRENQSLNQGQFRTETQSRRAQAHTVLRSALLLRRSLHSTSLPSFKGVGERLGTRL